MAAAGEFVEVDEFHAEGSRVVLVDVGVVSRTLSRAGAGARRAGVRCGGADDSDGAVVIAVALQVRGGARVFAYLGVEAGESRTRLLAKEDRGEGELRHGRRWRLPRRRR